MTGSADCWRYVNAVMLWAAAAEGLAVRAADPWDGDDTHRALLDAIGEDKDAL